MLRRTREDNRVELGASPRAGLMLLRAAKALALIRGRDHALPDDVQALAGVVLAHRLRLAPDAARGAGGGCAGAGVDAGPGGGGRREPRRRRGRDRGRPGPLVRSALGCAAL